MVFRLPIASFEALLQFYPLMSLFQDNLTALARYCAYQDRCTSEVERKLEELDVPADQHIDLINALKGEGYLNDARFAATYTRSKHHILGWGRKKIRFMLRQKGLGQQLIDQAITTELLDETYLNKLEQLIDRKLPLSKGRSAYERKAKVAQAMVAKGYEPELVWQILKTKPETED